MHEGLVDSTDEETCKDTRLALSIDRIPLFMPDIHHYSRTGPGKALVGEPKFDLGQWDPVYFQRQVAFAQKIIRETNRYDNIDYEICNEPGGGVEGHSSVQAVDEWQAAIAKVVQEEMAKLQNRHLIFGTQAFSCTPQFHPLTEATLLTFRSQQAKSQERKTHSRSSAPG